MALVNMKNKISGWNNELKALLVNPESIALIGTKPLKGTGTALVKRVASKILKTGRKKELGLISSSTADGFYGKLGFCTHPIYGGSKMLLDQQNMQKLCAKAA